MWGVDLALEAVARPSNLFEHLLERFSESACLVWVGVFGLVDPHDGGQCRGALRWLTLV
jgi:hypothetical protein